MRARGQIDQLDGVRALAVVAVMTFHDFLTGWGYLGVDVFFVLSGLLITGVLVGEADRRGGIDLRRFWARRLLRLYPALIVLVLLCSLVGDRLSQDGSWTMWWEAVAVTVTYTADIAILADGTQFLGALGPVWSLAVEMQFYLVWAVVLAFLLHRRVARAVLAAGTAVAAAAGLSLFWVLGTAPDPGLAVAPSYFRPDARFGELLAGCALALALSARREPLPRAADRALSAGAVAGLAVIVVGWLALGDHGTVAPIPVVVIGTTLVLARLVTSDTALLSRALRIPPLPQVGRISYAMYLWQLPIHALLISLTPSEWIQRTGFWVGTFVAGALSTHLVERRFAVRRAKLRRADVEDGGLDPASASGGAAHARTAGEPARLGDRSAA
ncbi:acyltransferase family protein [Capillimicrobium parvum]|uniref:acyltransferase family protein n=1 Tax=Capillimicrobium parvum TaxID=2884022 RepID=UPI00216B2BC0|nr:acyltransferase [Capillimicrobium parvum]